MQPCLKPRGTRKVEEKETQDRGKMEVERDNSIIMCLINSEINPSPSQLAEQLQPAAGTAVACPWLVPVPKLPVSMAGWQPMCHVCAPNSSRRQLSHHGSHVLPSRASFLL